MRTEDLDGPLLDYWCAQGMGLHVQPLVTQRQGRMVRQPVIVSADSRTFNVYSPTQDPLQAWDIITKCDMSVMRLANDFERPYHAHMHASGRGFKASAGNRLTAISRLLVLWRFGPEVTEPIGYMN